MEYNLPFFILCENTVQHCSVKVNVQIKRTPHPLYYCNCPCPRVIYPGLFRPLYVEPVNHAVEYFEYLPRKSVIPCKHVSQPERHAQHYLPHRNNGHHVINHVSGLFSHSPSSTARAYAPHLARERNKPLKAAVFTLEPGKASCKMTAFKELPELLFNEHRNTPPCFIPQPCLLKEFFQMIHCDSVKNRGLSFSGKVFRIPAEQGSLYFPPLKGFCCSL